MKNKAILGAMAMDLKRAALSYYRGSDAIAERFLEEALKRKNEVDINSVKPYVAKRLNELENIKKENNEKAAEDALLYSTIFQNASQT